MKRIFQLSLLFSLLSSNALFAQIDLYTPLSHLKFIVKADDSFSPPAHVVGGMFHTPTYMIHKLAGAGVQIFNVNIDSFDYGPGSFYNVNPVYSCPITFAEFKWVGGSSDIGIDSGLAMNTGFLLPIQNKTLGWPSDSIPGLDGGIAWPAIYNSEYYNVNGGGGVGFSPYAPPPDNALNVRNKQWPDLVSLNHGDSIADANIIQFDFVPDSNHIQIQYVFASEEYPNTNQPNYPATVCDTPNDVMGILLSGPGIQGEKNIALIPGTNIPVGVNTITPSGYKCRASDSQYYVDNSNGRNVIYNGFTTVLTAESAVIPRDTYHLKLAVADGAYHPEISDSILALNVDYMPHRAYYDSGIFFKAGSFLSYTKDTDTVTNISEQSAKMRLSVSPNPFSRSFQIQTNPANLNVYQLKLTDIMGRTVLSLEGTIQQINRKLATSSSLQQLPSGNYFMDIWLGKNPVPKHFKLVKIN